MMEKLATKKQSEINFRQLVDNIKFTKSNKETARIEGLKGC